MKTAMKMLDQVAKRWEERKSIRTKNKNLVEEDKIFEVESPERIQKRIDHLSKITKKPSIVERKVSLSQGIIHDIGLERVIGSDDFLGINFLEHGLAVSRSVCKINIFSSQGIFAGSGTGFTIAPNLIITNNHVIPNENIAKSSILEFDYQIDKNGDIMPSVFFSMNPSNFFVTNEDLDFTIIYINPNSKNNVHINNYGWNKLMDEGKALIGDPLNIIQHPKGGYKQIVLQSNELVDLLPNHAHYLTDTEPGSSGSLVCNNQWEVVALHHAGVPKRRNGKIIDINNNIWNGVDTEDIDWIANEGIRISKILQHLQNINIPVKWETHLKSIFESTPPDPIELASRVSSSKNHDYGQSTQNNLAANFILPKSITWDIPLKVTVSMGEFNITQDQNSNNYTPLVDNQNKDDLNLNIVEKNVVPYMDPDYSTRKGYDKNFLGIKVEMPEIIDKSKASKMDNGDYIIPYHNFSVVMNKKRRLAYFCASNVDGRIEKKEPESGKSYSRKALGGLNKNDREAWLTDPRIPVAHQLPDKFYNKDRKSFDKGHIIRRDDVAWGNTYEEVRIANGDTFHTTNCSPQVANYNRSNLGGIWGKFENHVLNEAEKEKLIVFSGPLFRSNDKFFEGFDDRGKIKVKIPKAFWKVVVCKSENSVKTFAFIFRQSLSDVDWDEVFTTPQNFKEYQCSIDDLEEKLDNIKFSDLLKETDQMFS